MKGGLINSAATDEIQTVTVNLHSASVWCAKMVNDCRYEVDVCNELGNQYVCMYVCMYLFINHIYFVHTVIKRVKCKNVGTPDQKTCFVVFLNENKFSTENTILCSNK